MHYLEWIVILSMTLYLLGVLMVKTFRRFGIGLMNQQNMFHRHYAEKMKTD